MAIVNKFLEVVVFGPITNPWLFMTLFFTPLLLILIITPFVKNKEKRAKLIMALFALPIYLVIAAILFYIWAMFWMAKSGNQSFALVG